MTLTYLPDSSPAVFDRMLVFIIHALQRGPAPGLSRGLYGRVLTLIRARRAYRMMGAASPDEEEEHNHKSPRAEARG